MLTESFVAATFAANKAVANASAALKDVGIFVQEFQPQSTFRHGFKKSSSEPSCVAISSSHIFAAQADKAVVNVYNREKGNQEATVPFPERVHSIAYAHAAEILVLGTESGKLILWEVATGRVTNSTAAHLQSISCLCITPKNEHVISGSADSSIHVWSLARLVSFEQPSTGYDNDEPSNAPVKAFTAHRNPISAIAGGHSSASTNFAVSASDDGTCYVWHVETCQVLRTLLLPSFAVSVTLDPADRAIYFGCNDGRIQSWDVFGQSATASLPLSSGSSLPPIQLLSGDSWKTPSTEIGSASCLTLSYDGTSLLSGHTNGAIVRWDVAKHRLVNEITNLGQPVTTLQMLTPEGFTKRQFPHYSVPQVVKPNLEFASMKDNGTCGIPANYNLNVMIATSQSASEDDGFHHALTDAGMPESMLDAAVRSLYLDNSSPSQGPPDDFELAKHERLEEEVSTLKKQIAALRDAEDKRKARKVARIVQRDEIGLKKREAYFEAKKQGKDGDAAMQQWERKEAEIDQESDEDLADGEAMEIS